MPEPDFLVHDEGDHIAVAARDVNVGPAQVVYMDSGREVTLDVREPVPLGHKVALVDIASEMEVMEYRARIGIARQAIERGSLVHVHNIRSARWPTQ
jgi:(2R)-sulfolactate sulfo-lyase subunit alpha